MRALNVFDFSLPGSTCGSGYYIDVGASELIANGSIKLKSGVDLKKLTEHSVILSEPGLSYLNEL
jgi:hypothetical protein